jgi:hypothetical protein
VSRLFTFKEENRVAQEREANGGAARWLGWNFALAILVSAFLLFQVQPLISKSILPWFGGCPAVWTTAMLFFQTALFAGYVYAHLLQRWLRPRQQAAVHFVVVAAALAALVLMRLPPGPSWKPLDSSHPTWHVLVLLSASVGLPYFALSATSPLIQAWFSRVWADRSPYRLYALSNVGSLAGLLSYPFLFEPAFDLTQQSGMWFLGFVVYGVLCAAALACLAGMRHADSGERVGEAPSQGPAEAPAAAPGMRDRLLWLALPAAASLMLLATTNHVCQNIAVVPFLWVVPLTLYLLSFIICFDHQRWYVRGLWATAAVLALVAAAGNDEFWWFEYRLNIAQELALYFAALFCTCMVCHGELVRLKPDPRHLTEFYLLISAGGALGGIFVGLVAPLVFTTFFEWSIGLVLSCAIAITVLALSALRRTVALADDTIARQAAAAARLLLVPAAIGGLVYIVMWQVTGWAPAIDRARNFYGVVSVFEYDRDDPQKHERILKHGAITHGEQYLDPVKSHWATTYYSEQSGVGRTIRFFRERGPVRVGMVGLGVGTLATYARPGDRYRFYEINPEVLRMARAHFTYLADCQVTPEVEMGDARLSLERELSTDDPPQFDVLVLDAFSGDSIPAHLLTEEAFEIYRPHVAPGGVIAVHITNRYLYLAPVVRGLARHFGLDTVRIYTPDDKTRAIGHSDWMMLTNNQDFLRAVKPSPPPDAEDDFSVPLWTDQYNNLFQILRHGS